MHWPRGRRPGLVLVWLRDRSRVTTYCNDDGVRDHHGEHSNQREEHADSIPSHLQLSVASRRMAFSLRRTAWRRRRGHDLILPCEGS